MKLRKTQVAAAVGAALLVSGAVVQAQTVTPSQSQVAVQLYGQVHRALMAVDDGHQSKLFNVDGQPSSTRFGITGGSNIAAGLRAGFRFETEFKSNPANTVRINAESSSPTLGERHFDVWFQGGWGQINLGQGSGAADGASENDLSGTGLANGIGVADWAGGIRWRTAAGGTISGPLAGETHTVESTINQQDFESRYDRVMYTTPTLGGFFARVGYGTKSNTTAAKEASLWYGAKLGGLGQIAAAIGWSKEEGGAQLDFTSTTTPGAAPTVITTTTTRVIAPENETVGGSVSWLHGSGLNLTASYTQSENQVSASSNNIESFLGKSKFTYIKAGWKAGQHAIAVDYAIAKDFAFAGDESTMYGVGYVWLPTAWAEIYAAYKLHSLDRPAVSVEDIQVFTLGTRLRF